MFQTKKKTVKKVCESTTNTSVGSPIEKTSIFETFPYPHGPTPIAYLKIIITKYNKYKMRT